MKQLFSQEINGVESWIKIYQSAKIFEPLIKEIFKKHELSFTNIKNLTPGSNVVFKINDKVIKIFAPIESGFTTGVAFHIEKQALLHSNSVINSAPKIIFSGVINDKYEFQYIIMEYISGNDFNTNRNSYSERQKQEFAYNFKKLTTILNTDTKDKIIPQLTKEFCIENDRWDVFFKSFCDDRKTEITNISFDNCVYVHGDLKATNVIIDNNKKIHIIDFADSFVAPFFYEWPFIVFGLFGCDHIMMKAYFGNYENDIFLETLTQGLLIHKFGVGILMQLCELTNTPINSIVNIQSLTNLLKECIQKGDALIN